jgi:diguanylate cyclase (GGDEF)-like protein
MHHSEGVPSHTTARELCAAPIPPIAACDRQPSLLVIRGRDHGRLIPIDSTPAVIGSGSDIHIRLDDFGVSRRHACLTRLADEMVLNDLGSTNGTWCNGRRVTSAALNDGDQLQLGASQLTFRLNHPEEIQWLAHLYHRATRDHLTGLFNRSSLEDRLEVELSRERRHPRGLAVILLDLDHFKQVNDRFGHPAGDQVLEGVSGCLTHSLRSCDLAARLGGEEFVVVLPETDLPQAWTIAERIRIGICGLRLAGVPVPITASLGVAVATPGTCSIHDLLDAADQACYRAKRGGRNRVIGPAPRESDSRGDSPVRNRLEVDRGRICGTGSEVPK